MADPLPAAYYIYRYLTGTAAPLILFYLRKKKYTWWDQAAKWTELIGQAETPRPLGPLLWFHAVSVGEGAAAVPVIRRCLQERPSVHILMTTRDMPALSLWQKMFPTGVTCQLAPVDTPEAVEGFLRHWRPQAGVLVESELWPNLLCSPLLDDVPLALLNARISPASFERWSGSLARPLVESMLQRFSLVAPPNTTEAVRLQVLGANPLSVRFAGDLKYATSAVVPDEQQLAAAAEELRRRIGERHVWMAASTHPGEEEVAAEVHSALREAFPDLLTIIAPRHPKRGPSIVKALLGQGFSVAQRSRQQPIGDETEVYVADTMGELRMLYQVVPTALVGGSLLPGLQGHNVAEAAFAGCAVLTGPHVGHFTVMIADLQALAPLSVCQVGDKRELVEALRRMLGNGEELQARRMAARHAAHAAAAGLVDRVWAALDSTVLSKAFGKVVPTPHPVVPAEPLDHPAELSA